MKWIMTVVVESEKVDRDVGDLAGRIRACGLRGDETRQDKASRIASTPNTCRYHVMLFAVLYGLIFCGDWKMRSRRRGNCPCSDN